MAHDDDVISTDTIVYRDSYNIDDRDRGIDWEREIQEEAWREVDRAIQTGVKMVAWKSCMECGRLTKGSRGAAGYFWARLCQPCKNQADEDVMFGLMARERIMAHTLDQLFIPAFSLETIA